MSYERDDRRFGNQGDRGYGGFGSDRSRDWGHNSYGRGEDRTRGAGADRFGGNDRSRYGERRDYGGDPRGYDYQDRGLLDRAGDEVRSWFGDEDAERRRQADERYYDRQDPRGDDRGDRGYERGAGASAYGQGSYGQGDRGYGAGSYAGNDGVRSAGRPNSGNRHDHDPSYRSWRDRQMDSFDRDYEDYRREHQSRFDSEFKTWREGRQGQRDLLGKVQEHFEVVGMDGEHVGVVDHVKGDQIELTKNDKDAGGRHHLIPSTWLKSVEGNKVTLSKTADQAKQHWRDEARDAGDNADRAQSRERSFSGNN